MDLLNDAFLEEWRALPLRRSPVPAVAAARTGDAAAETLDARLVDAVRSLGKNWLIYRSRHRQEHLDQIERVVPA